MTAAETARRLQEARRLDAAGDWGKALFAYTLLLRLDPGCRDAKTDLAGLLMVQDRHPQAEQLCREVLAEDPACQAARLNLAGALLGQARFQEADLEYHRLIQEAPDLALAQLGLGTSLCRQGRLQEARLALELAVRLDPGHAQARESRLHLLLQLKAWPEARAAWNQVAEQDLDGFSGTLEKTVVLLTFGDFEAGWELMERRLDRPGFILPERHYPQPRWDGRPFPGQTLLLHWEQGYGDTLMFIRYAELAKARGGRVLVLAQRPLLPVLATAAGIDQLLAPGDPLPDFDFQVSLFSLAQVFGTRLDSIPARIPYLAAPAPVAPELVSALAGSDLDRAEPSPGPGLRVGLIWAGSTAHRSDGIRSLTAATLAPLAELPGITWYSLQMGYEGGLPFPGIRDLAPHLRDFGVTAQVLERMDLVITVDTAVAHLAGALGRPTWLLLPFIAEWRWLLEREDSPWYPTFRLFRQDQPTGWEPVLARVAAALLERLRGTC